MKTKILAIVSLLLIIISVHNVKTSFSSNKSLYYDAQTKEITYYNIDSQDIFNNFKNLIPGDIREDEITINVINAQEAVNMYLKMDFDENKDIIDNIIIRVYKDDTEITKNNEMFKVLDDNSQSVTLKIIIAIPTSLGNEITEYSKNFKMQFLIEDNNEIIEVPQTYESNIYIYYITLFISLILLIYTIRKFLKDNKKKAL